MSSMKQNLYLVVNVIKDVRRRQTFLSVPYYRLVCPLIHSTVLFLWVTYSSTTHYTPVSLLTLLWVSKIHGHSFRTSDRLSIYLWSVLRHKLNLVLCVVTHDTLDVFVSDLFLPYGVVCGHKLLLVQTRTLPCFLCLRLFLCVSWFITRFTGLRVVVPRSYCMVLLRASQPYPTSPLS